MVRRLPLLPLVMLLFCGVCRSTRAAELLPPERPIAAVIDHYVDAKLQIAATSPTPSADDLTLVRRTTLDLAGRIPTVAEVKAYVESPAQDKRVQLVERLLASPDFVRHQAESFDALLMYGTRDSLRDYLVQAFTENRPWDQMFREMLLGRQDDPEQKGPLRFVKARVQDTDKLTNEVSVLFFGVNVSCAQCHDHPLVADWSQDHFYGMKSFFGRTFENGGFVGERAYGLVSFQTTSGESRAAKLMFLSGEEIAEPAAPEPDNAEKKKEKEQLEALKKNKQPPPPPPFSRRAQLIDAGLKSPGNLFAKAIVNQLWNRFLGRGLVMPVDQMHSANPPSHPELLEWLARDLANHGYDLRRLIRGIVASQTYTRSSEWESAERPADELFAVASLRPLSPQQYAVSLRLASTNPDPFLETQNPIEAQKRLDAIASSARGMSEKFESPREDFQVSVEESLLLSNGDRVDKEILRDANDSLIGKLKSLNDRQQAIDVASWSIFGRPPTPEESEAFRAFLARREDRPVDGYRHLVWAMLTSSECRFNY